MAALMVERGHVDLRAQVTVNGVCSLPGDDVKILLSDHSRAKVWSASHLSFALWYVHCSFHVSIDDIMMPQPEFCKLANKICIKYHACLFVRQLEVAETCGICCVHSGMLGREIC